VAELVRALEARGTFGNIEVEEVLVRPYKATPTRLRPMDRMVAHTGYLVFARKVSREAGQARYWMDRKRRKYEEAQEDGSAKNGHGGDTYEGGTVAEQGAVGTGRGAE
jgi:tRNA (adenine57-N1/adenine58-N1)-methyltransferase